MDWAFLTPSYARLLKPDDIPSLARALLAGEAVSADNFATEVDKVRLLNSWGLSETCIFSSIHE